MKTNQFTAPLTTPGMLMRSKYKIIIPSFKTRPKGRKTISVRIKPPKLFLHKWYTQQEQFGGLYSNTDGLSALGSSFKAGDYYLVFAPHEHAWGGQWSCKLVGLHGRVVSKVNYKVCVWVSVEDPFAPVVEG
uniref:Capsid protein n=1 Tax=Torque teno virus TaxID=68887 RepID=A0A7L8Y9K3_9VIRU|nr:hypothetical protein [Torque teno virus]